MLLSLLVEGEFNAVDTLFVVQRNFLYDQVQESLALLKRE
jgi:hypothetical protein